MRAPLEFNMAMVFEKMRKTAAFPGLVFALAAILVCLQAWASFAQDMIYKWTDDQGIVHFVDSAEAIPPRFRGRVEQKKVERRAPPQPQISGTPSEPATKADKAMDAKGRGKDWWLAQKKYWQDEADRLKAQVEKNKKDLTELRRGRVRQGERTKDGILLGQGPLIHDYRELKRLEEVTQSLEHDLAKAQQMVESGLIENAQRAGAPAEWVDELKGKQTAGQSPSTAQTGQ